ncbi:hypothetical protein [Kaistia soli]|uniref:hypothetical protein n=1 Tax=Kaistia soli TaxID=446684 RepID=UPI00093319D9|nr:hypothetical protein [Kaistia soli]
MAATFATLAQFGAPKAWRVIVGTRGLKGSVLPGRRYARGGYPALANEVQLERTLREVTGDAPRALIFAFVQKTYDACAAPNLDLARYEQLLSEES